jgi:hypothetical protein
MTLIYLLRNKEDDENSALMKTARMENPTDGLIRGRSRYDL